MNHDFELPVVDTARGVHAPRVEAGVHSRKVKKRDCLVAALEGHRKSLSGWAAVVAELGDLDVAVVAEGALAAEVLERDWDVARHVHARAAEAAVAFALPAVFEVFGDFRIDANREVVRHWHLERFLRVRSDGFDVPHVDIANHLRPADNCEFPGKTAEVAGCDFLPPPEGAAHVVAGAKREKSDGRAMGRLLETELAREKRSDPVHGAVAAAPDDAQVRLLNELAVTLGPGCSVVGQNDAADCGIIADDVEDVAGKTATALWVQEDEERCVRCGGGLNSHQAVVDHVCERKCEVLIFRMRSYIQSKFFESEERLIRLRKLSLNVLRLTESGRAEMRLLHEVHLVELIHG